MRLSDLFEQDKSDTLMPQNANEFEHAWAALKREADDFDDIDFYSNDVIKNDVHAILRKDGYRMSLGKAESLYRRQMAKKSQPAPQKPALAPSKPTATPKATKPAPKEPENVKLKGKSSDPAKAKLDLELKGKLGKLQKWASDKLSTGAKASDKYTKSSFK